MKTKFILFALFSAAMFAPIDTFAFDVVPLWEPHLPPPEPTPPVIWGDIE